MKTLHQCLAIAAVLLAAGALATKTPHGRGAIPALDLGRRIANGDTLLVYDLRSASAFELLHVPGASNTTVDALLRQSPGTYEVVLYDQNGSDGAHARRKLQSGGYDSVHYLRGGMYAWITQVLEPRLAVDATPAETKEFEDAARLSRFFGGTPRANVARSEIPPITPPAKPVSGEDAAEQVRRRGC